MLTPRESDSQQRARGVNLVAVSTSEISGGELARHYFCDCLSFTSPICCGLLDDLIAHHSDIVLKCVTRWTRDFCTVQWQKVHGSQHGIYFLLRLSATVCSRHCTLYIHHEVQQCANIRVDARVRGFFQEGGVSRANTQRIGELSSFAHR